MNDPCKADPLTLTVDTGCQWDRAVTLWNAGLSGKAMTILIVAVLIGCAVCIVRLVADIVKDDTYRARRRHARRALARARRRHPVGGWHR